MREWDKWVEVADAMTRTVLTGDLCVCVCVCGQFMLRVSP